MQNKYKGIIDKMKNSNLLFEKSYTNHFKN